VSIEQIEEFRRALELGAAERQVPTTQGVGLFSDSVPNVYDANFFSVDGPGADPDRIAAETESVMERYHHRRVVVERGGDALAAALMRHGYQLSTHLVLAHAHEPDRRVDTSMVREVEFERLVPARVATTVAEPWGDHEIAEQLNGAKRLITRAVPTRFFAAIVDGQIASYCELRSDGRTAQIEDVEAVHAYRGRGLGRAIVQHALDEARRDHEVVFLEALADDWPRQLYERLGFDVVGRRDFLTKFPHPLTRIRLRTPRLELRVPTVAERRKLFEVAQAGIHDPAEMPFGVAWTDNLDEKSFLAHDRDKLAAGTPEDWSLPFAVFLDGEPIGVQELRGERFAERHSVDTGSWLGARWQGQGLGTEMRAAVLALAFTGLGAEVATSGAIEGNPASLGVSQRLGYEVVGAHTVSPRGIPVEHVDLELRRERFRSPVEVEIAGLAGLLELFGAL
jgi:RimJ/RimL family protein N-acetyltransferase/predicted GNAT family acetyltransferase